jgi:hypothetical protein
LLVLALGYAIGLAPALAAWAERFASEPRTRYALGFSLLMLIAMATGRRGEPAPKRGLVWSAAALGVQVAAILAGMTKAAVFALPLGVLGYTQLTGVSSVAPTILAAFSVPLPHAVVSLGNPQRAWISLAESMLGPAASQLALTGWDSGVTLVALFAGLSCYASARMRLPVSAALRRAAISSALAVPAQLALMAGAVALVRAGGTELARALLSDAPWMLSTLIVLGFVESRRRRELQPRAV